MSLFQSKSARLVSALIAATISICGAVVASSDEPPGVIAVSGSATEQVFTDVLRIVFELQTDAATFTIGKETADTFKEQLAAVPGARDEISVSVDHDFGSLKQQSLYWRKGSKTQHRFTVTLTDIPVGTLHTVFVEFVDNALQLSSKLTVAEVESEVSDNQERVVQHKLIRQAVANARDEAETIADAAGLHVKATKAVYSGVNPNIQTTGGYFSLAESIVIGRSRKGFSIQQGPSDTVEMTANIVAVYIVEEI